MPLASTLRWKSPKAWKISSTDSSQLAPSRNNWWQPLLSGLWILPGIANTSRLWDSAVRAVINEPLLMAASTTMVARLSPLIMRLRMGN